MVGGALFNYSCLGLREEERKKRQAERKGNRRERIAKGKCDMFGDTFHRRTLEWTFPCLLQKTKTMLQLYNVLVWDLRRSPAWLLWFFKGHPPSCCCNWSPVRGSCCSILSALRLWISVSGCATNRCYGSRIKSVRGKKNSNNNGCAEGAHGEPIPLLMYKIFHVCFMNY